MSTTSKPQFAQRFRDVIRPLTVGTLAAIILLTACNELRAADLEQGYAITFTAADSLFRTRFNPAVSPGKSTGWKPYNRFANFYNQRAYPFETIPAEARFVAWEEMSQQRGSRNLDENWEQMGPTNLAGRALSVEWDPTNTNIIYCGSASGGLWKSVNGGTSWTSLTDNLPTLAIGSIAIDPTNTNIIYIGTGEGSYNIDAVYGAGVFKSLDGGTTWNTTGLSWSQSQGGAINKVLVDPTNTQIIYAASSRQISGGGIYKSVNGGTSWTRYHTGDVKDMVMHPDSASVLYCAVGYPWGHSDNGVFKSVNGGLNWTRLSSGLPAATSMGRSAISISESNPQVLYLGLSSIISSGSGFAGMYRSNDGGATWTLQSTTPNMYASQGWYNIVCKVDPTNSAIVYSNGLDCYKSADSGVNWTRKSVWSYPPGNSQYAHADHHDLAFMPGNPSTIIVATDGGLYKSTNGGDTWVGINSGLVTYQFYAMDHDALQPNVTYGGTQDNGTNKHNNSPTWTAVLGGDGGYCNVDFTNSNIVYAETQRGSHYKSVNGGSSWSYIGSGITGEGAWVTPVEMDPTNPSTLITATRRLWKTINGGSTWSVISPDTSSQYVSCIAIAPSDPNRIYFSFEYTGQVWRTVNGGTNWNNMSSGLPNRYVTRIAVHPTDPNTAYVSLSGYGTGHVYKTVNGGSSWTNSSTGLVDVPCNDIVIDRNNPQYMYVGNDLGVYASTDAGASWVEYSNGIPNVVVEDLSLHPTSGMLRAATHGRGMWQTSTAAPSIAVLTPNGGDSWPVGSSQNFTWSTGGIGGNISIELNRSYPGGTWETISASTANDGIFAWTVTGATTTTARVRISSIEQPALTDESNANFTINQPSITVVAPNGGEQWVWNTTNTISWNATGTTGPFVIELTRAYLVAPWETIATVSGATSYNWLTLGLTTTAARVRVYLQSNPAIGDTSNNNFAIVQPTITLAAPNGGETLTPGETTVIRWARANLTGTVRVEINRTYPSATWTSINSAVPVDSLVWTVDGPGSTTARIRVISNFNSTVGDTSAANFTIPSPTLTLSVPNGGEVWNAGTNQTVRWTRANFMGGVNVYVNRNYPGGTWDPIAINVAADSFVWAVSTPNSNNARVRVASVNLPTLLDESNANFNIGTALELIAPNGAESWNAGTSYTISWNRFNASGNVTIEVDRSYPSGTWETVATNVSTNSYAWTVTGPPTTTARVRIYLAGNPTVGDSSANNFTINATGIALDVPLGGETWNVGSVQTIAWTRTNAIGNVTVQISRNYGAGTTWTSLTTTASGSTYNWTVTSPVSSTCRIRVFLTANSAVGDTCNSNFSIVQPTLALTTPNGGENWPIGSSQTIRWTRTHANGNVTVQLNRAYPGGAWENLSTGTAADSLPWTVSGAAATTCRIKIYLNSQTNVGDTSNANFTLSAASIAVTAPNGGESWVLGLPYNITFTRTNASGPVTVAVNRTYPSGTWEVIDTNVTANSVSWTATGAPSTTARVRAILNATPAIRDSSNANFSLVTPALVLTAPNGGENLYVGSSTTITWSRTNVTGAVSVLINRNYPAGSWDTLSTNQTGSSMSWTVSGAATSNARFKVVWNSLATVYDESNADVQIAIGSLSLLAPNGGESYTLGGPMTIRWSRSGAAGNVTVQLNRTYPGGAWENLTTTAAADSFVWTASGAASTQARMRVRLTSDSTVNDVSAANFSLVSRTLALTMPNGGETLYTGSTATIAFTRTNATGNVTILLNRNYPAGTWETLANNVSTSSYDWAVSGATSTNARIRIFLNSETFVADTSNAAFSIATPSVTLTAPNGGEAWVVGSSQNVTWTRGGFSENVRLELNRSYPAGTWETLAASVAGNSYAWTVTSPTTTTARVRVISTVNSSIRDSSNANFSIVVPQLALTIPNGGEVVNLGLPYTIRWTRSNAPGAVQLQMKRDYPNGTWENLPSSTADSVVWMPSGTPSTTARIRLYLISDPSIGDTSNAAFTLQQPALILTAPNGGESWLRNSTHAITWTRTGLTGAVRIDFNSAYPGGSWTTIASGQTGNSWAWSITQATTAAARIRIVYEPATTFGDTSAANFAIISPALTVTSPNGNEQFVIGTPYNITLTRTDHPGAVTIQLNRNYPSAVWENLTTGYTGTSFSWLASGPASLNARVRVISEIYTSPLLGDTSNANFRIVSPGITVLAPDGGEQLAVGGLTWLRWIRVAVGNVDVLLNRNYPGGTWETIVPNINADSISWAVSGPATGTARIKIWATADHNTVDQSAGNFSIIQPQLTITAPVLGDTLAIGVANLISWTRNAVTGNVRVDINRTYPSSSWTTIGTVAGDELSWIGSAPASNTTRLRIVSTNMSWVGDTTDFSMALLLRTLTLTAPASSDTVAIGEPLPLQWSRSNLGPGANIYLSREIPPVNWELLASNVTADQWTWSVTGPRTDFLRLKVLSNQNSAIGDTTPPQIIVMPEIIIESHNAGTIGIGNSEEINWTRFDAAGPVDLAVNRNYPSGAWETIATGIEGNSVDWTVTGPVTDFARFRVTLSSAGISDESDTNLCITNPLITVTYPNGGELFDPNDVVNVQWAALATQSNFHVELNTDYPAGSWQTIANNVAGSSVQWTVPNEEFEHGRIRVSMQGRPEVADLSNADFGTQLPGIYIINSNGLDTLITGSVYTARWGRANASGTARLELNRNYPGGSWEQIGNPTTADSVVWTVTGPSTTTARFRITLVFDTDITDVSDENFAILPQSITLFAPVAGDSVGIGDTLNFSWQRVGIPAAVTISVKRNWPAGSWETLASNVAQDSWQWIAAGSASENARFRIMATGNTNVADTTNGAVRVGTQTLQFAFPAMADTFRIGEEVNLQWTRRFVRGTVRVELSRNGTGGPWEELGITSGNDLAWQCSGPATNNARLRISRANQSWVAALTPFNINLVEPRLILLSPTSAQPLSIGRDVVIAWDREYLDEPVDVLVNTGFVGASIYTLRQGVTGDSIHWTVAGNPGETIQFILRSEAGAIVETQSEGGWEIGYADLNFVSPVGGETYLTGQTLNICWDRDYHLDPVRVDLNRDYPAGTWETLAISVAETTFAWVVSGASTESARLRILSTVDSQLGDTTGDALHLITPGLTIVSPAANARLPIGFAHTITWTRLAVPGQVIVYLSRNGGSSYELLSSGVSGDSLLWTPTEPATTQAQIRLVSAVNPAIVVNSANFTLATPQITLLAPNGGESVILGQPVTMRWSESDHPANVSLELNRNYPNGSWESLFTNSSGDSVVWVSLGSATGNARIRVSSTVNSSWSDVSNNSFSLIQPGLDITAPVAGSLLLAGDSVQVVWARTGVSVPVNVYLRYENGQTQTLGSGLNTDALVAIVPATESQTSWLVVRTASGAPLADSIWVAGPHIPALTITTPEADARWILNAPYTIRWNRYFVNGNITVQVNRDWPSGPWENITTTAVDSVNWTPSSSGTLHLRILSNNRPALMDERAVNVVAPAIEILPFAESAYRIGQPLPVSWSAHEISQPMTLEINRDYPSGAWHVLYQGAAEHYEWLADGEPAEHVRFRVSATEELLFSDVSDSDLTLYRAALDLDAAPPTGVLHVGDSVMLDYTFVGDAYPVEIEIRRDAGAWETIASGETSGDYLWVVTEPLASDVWLRARVLEDEDLIDSVGAYSIEPPAPQLAFTWPTETGIDTVGIARTIAWQWTNGAGMVRLEVTHGGDVWELLADSTNDISFAWMVTGPVTDLLQYRVTSVNNSDVNAVSATRSVVWPTVTINSGGGTWYIGEERWIRWSRADFAGPVEVEVSRGDRAEPWEALATTEIDSFLWTVTGPETELAAIRVRALGFNGIVDTTDVPLVIRAPQITVVEPNGGELLDEESQIRLRWIAEGVTGDVAIGLWRGEPVNRLDTLFLSTANDSNEIWTVTGPAALGCYLVVLDANNHTLYDSSDAPFEIRPLAADEWLGDIPREYALLAPYPNPFNAQATITFDLPQNGDVKIMIFDLLGRTVAVLLDEPRSAGRHRIPWDASRIGSGQYFVRMTAADFAATRKLLLIK